MNKLRLTNKNENHFYLDFNWKDKAAHLSVSWQTETVHRHRQRRGPPVTVGYDAAEPEIRVARY